jgi:hypothetical protein
MEQSSHPRSFANAWSCTLLRTDKQILPFAGEHFEGWLDQLAKEAAGSASSFAQFVGLLPGVPPDQAMACLNRMSASSEARQVQFLLMDAAIDHAPPFLDQSARLPLPHPADSEFRFDNLTAQRLAAQLVRQTNDGDEILLVGTPTVALALADLQVDRRIRFVGSDDCVTDAIRNALSPNLVTIGAAAGRTASVALVDPPWYAEPMRAMISTCARGVKLGGVVWIVMPAIGTKLDAADDRLDFQRFAKSCGMRQSGRSAEVTYRTPLFELAAIEQQGIARLENWRSADVFEMIVREEVAVPSLQPPPRVIELTTGGLRLRLANCTQKRPLQLVPISSHEVFPSVSFRAAGRRSATLWTSGNRAFNVDATTAFAALSAISDRNEGVLHGRLTLPQNATYSNKDIEPTRRLIHELLELIDREKSDARRLVGDGAWLDTAKGWKF